MSLNFGQCLKKFVLYRNHYFYVVNLPPHKRSHRYVVETVTDRERDV